MSRLPAAPSAHPSPADRRGHLTRPARTVAAVALGAVTLAACSSDPAPEDGSLALVSAGTLTVCTNPPYEPFEYEQDGEIVGFDIDLTRAVAEDLGLDLSVVSTGFEGIQSGTALETGMCDVVASAITITPEREAKIDFSEPYFEVDQGLLVAEGTTLTSPDELDGLTVGVQQATTGEYWADEQGLDTVQFEDLGLQVQAVRTGQIDVAVNDVSVLLPFEGEDLTVATTVLTGEQYGLGVRTGSTELLAAIDATLTRLRGDGGYDALYTEHFGTAPAEPGSADG